MDLSKIKCVIFDADNTLYSTKKAAKDADMAAMDTLGHFSKKDSETLYKEFIEIVSQIKNSPDPKVRHRKYSYGLLSAKYGIDVLNQMYEAFQKTLLEKIELVPGIVDLLDKLKGRELWVITEDNREMAEKKLEKLGILDRFNRIVSSDDAGIMKPARNYYSEVLSKFKPEEILVLGDNYEKDLKLPEELGMSVILIGTSEDFKKINI